MASDSESLGEIIRRKRELSEMSMRRFAEVVGISNPYLSQIERGLRAPSKRVMEAIAETLEVSADALYERAGLKPQDEDVAQSRVIEAIKQDPLLTGRQRQALLEIYQSFTVHAHNSRPKLRRRSSDGRASGQPGSEPNTVG